MYKKNMNTTELKTLPYFTQSEEERREKKVLAISDIAHIQETPWVIVVWCGEDMHDVILETLTMSHTQHLAGKTILVVEAWHRMWSIGEFGMPEELKAEAMQKLENTTMIIQSYREECIDVFLEKPKHPYQKQTHHYPIGKPQKSKAAHIRYPGIKNK